MKKKMKQGAKAVKSGGMAENVIEHIFKFIGFETFNYKNAPNKEILAKKKKYVLKEVPYDKVDGHKGKTEFVAYKNNKPVRIEVKVQHRTGSVTDKLYATVINAAKAYPENDIIILVDGKGVPESTFKYLKNELLPEVNTKNKNIKMMHIVDFMDYAMQAFA